MDRGLGMAIVCDGLQGRDRRDDPLWSSVPLRQVRLQPYGLFPMEAVIALKDVIVITVLGCSKTRVPN
jgi:hypothetical protein